MAAHRSSFLSSARRVISTPSGAIGLGIIAFLLIFGVLGRTVLAGPATVINVPNAYEDPSLAHFLGTDELGRDLFARVAYATGLSLTLALCATAIGVVGGLILGSVPWFAKRRIAALSTAVVDVAIAFPTLLIVLFMAVILGRSTMGAMIAIGIALIPWYARLTQNMIASVRDREYVLAALTQGQNRFQVLVRHILPNVGEPLVVNATLGAASALLSFAGLSFLGLGLQAPEYDWGLLLNENMNSIFVTPWAALAPATMVVLAGLGFNLLGEAIARSLDAKKSDSEQPAAAPILAVENASALVEVSGLTISATYADGQKRPIVDNFDLTVPPRRIVGIVGESGSGKSITAQAMAQITDEALSVESEVFALSGESFSGRSNDADLVRKVGYVFQDSGSSFNPTMRLGAQVVEVLQVHQKLPRAPREAVAVESLERVGILDAAVRSKQYPHEFSGGMRQRAMIAMTMAPEPKLVIADEPTTALDVSLKGKILGLLRELRDRDGASVVIISHDISSLLGTVDDLVVMYGGRVIERGAAATIAQTPQHPYSRALLAAVPTMSTPRDVPLATIPGRPVDFSKDQQGCRFAARCPIAMPVCQTSTPELQRTAAGAEVACHAYGLNRRDAE